MLAQSETASQLSAAAQTIAVLMAFFICRFTTRSRSTIGVVSFLGGLAATFANIVVDGQGACVLMGYSPLIYLGAVAGRRDLRWDW